MASFEQKRKVDGYIERGVKDGAKLVSGGPIKDEALKSGAYVVPTIFDNVAQDMEMVHNEIFGPVVAVLSFKDEAEALEMANGQWHRLWSFFLRLVKRYEACL
jgi:aldehyde dehydrogenase (NAD+)